MPRTVSPPSRSRRHTSAHPLSLQTLQLAPSPKPPDPPVLLWSCFPACAQEWGELFPDPLSPPLKAAPFLPWGSEKLTDPQDGGHLSFLHPGPCSPALGFPS